MYFKAPKIEQRQNEASPASTAFYRAMIVHQQKRNEKLQIFEAEIKDRKIRELSQLQTRNEKQAHAVKELQLEANRDRAWEGFVIAITKLCAQAGSSPSLRTFVEKELRQTVRGGAADRDPQLRRSKFEKLVSDVCTGKQLFKLSELNGIATAGAADSHLPGNTAQITQLIQSIGSLHTELTAAVKAAYHASSDVQDMIQHRDRLNKLLQPGAVLLAQLQASSRDSEDTVHSAQEILRTLNHKLEVHATKLETERAQQQQQQQSAQAAQAQPSHAQSSNVRKTSANSDGLDILLPRLSYLNSDASSANWLEDIKKSAMQMQLPDVLEMALVEAQKHLRYTSLSNSQEGAAAATVSSERPTAGVALVRVDALLAELESLLHAVVKGGSQAFLRVFITLSEAVVEEVELVSSEEDILMYTVIVCGIFRALSVNMHKQSAKILHALLLSRSCACIPNFLTPGAGVGNSGTRVSMLYAGLVGHAVDVIHSASGGGEAKASSPLSAAQGWQWLHRACTQLHLLTSLFATTSSTEKEVATKLRIKESSISSACKTIRSFLRLSGNSLFLKYQDRFDSLLQTLRTTLEPVSIVADASKLLMFIESSVNAKNIVPAYYRSQAPFMLDTAALTRYVDNERQMVATADKNKQTPFMVRVKELQIDRLRVIFNKLSVTVESQQAAVKSLLEKIIVSNKEGPEFLRYTLYKISSNLSTDCQEEFFNEMDEGHPLKLARVTCGLHSSMKELGDLIKAQFCKQCPLCIPKAAELGLSGEAFLADMGFRQKAGGSWEDKSQWLARMSKMLCTYCVMMLQPEQQPLSLADAWAWLANIINLSTPKQATTTGTDAGPKPPFFTATALEVMLRVTAQELLRAYGDKFMSLLIIVQDVILPHMAEDAPRHAELKTFLRVFISSGGREFMSLFNKPLST